MYKTNRQIGGGTEILLHKNLNKTSKNKSTNAKMLSNQNLFANNSFLNENVNCSLLVKWLCSPLLLTLLLFAYICFGALLFHYLESGAELLNVANVVALRNNTLQRLWNITFTFNLLYPRNWTANATIELIQFERAVIYMVRQHGYNGFNEFLNEPNSLETVHENLEQWTLSGALLYSLSIISTIGSGNLSPRTSSGKIATMLYALIGVPIMLCFLASFGNILAENFRKFYESCCYCNKKQALLAQQEIKQRQSDLQNLYRLQYLQQKAKNKNQKLSRKKHKKNQQAILRNNNENQINDHYHVHLLNSNSINDTTNNHHLFSTSILTNGQQILTEPLNNSGQNNTVTFLEPDSSNKLSAVNQNCSDNNCNLLVDHSPNNHLHHNHTHLVPTSSQFQQNGGIHYCTISNRQQLSAINQPSIPAYCNSTHHQLIAANQPDNSLAYNTTFKYGTLPNTVIINQPGLDSTSLKNNISNNCCTAEQAAALIYNNGVPTSDHYHLDNYGNLLSLTATQNNITNQSSFINNGNNSTLLSSQCNTIDSNSNIDEHNKLNEDYLNNINSQLIDSIEKKENKNLIKKISFNNTIKDKKDDSNEDGLEIEINLDDTKFNELDLLDDPLFYNYALELSKKACSVANSKLYKIKVPLSLCLTIIIIYIIFGAILLHIWERRNMLDAIYYCFLTLTTIGYNSAANYASSSSAETPFGNGFWLDFVDNDLNKKHNYISSQHHSTNLTINTPKHNGHTSSNLIRDPNLNSIIGLKKSLLGSLSSGEPNNELLILFTIYLIGGMLIIAMCFNLIQDHLVLRVLNRYELINKKNLSSATDLNNFDKDQTKLKSDSQSNIEIDDFDV